MSIILPQEHAEDQMFFSRIDNFFSQFALSKLLSKCNFYKESGFACVVILKELFTLVFRGRNMHRTLTHAEDELPFKKNTGYRFLNSGRFNWERFLRLFMTNQIAAIDRLTDKDRQSVLIFDDSLLSRNRSKKVELLAKVFDHTTGRYMKGFRMMTLGWSDGNSFLPIAFHLLSSQKPKNVVCPAVIVDDRRTVAHKRREMATQCTTDVVISMLQEAKDIPAKFVLFDSWFTMPKTVIRVRREHREVIGMLKQCKVHYRYDGKWQDLESLYRLLKPQASPGGQILGSLCVKIREENPAEEADLVEVRIVFVKDRRSSNWLALLCTDLAVGEEEIVRIYGKRWDIEVFFKVCKSFLALAKEFQGRSYDMQVATTTIVFLRYAMLAIEARNAKDERTLGDLFYYLREEMADMKLSQSLMLLIDTLRHVLNDMPLLSRKMADAIMESFLMSLPPPFRRRLLLSA